jgi:hypothetical protein
VVLEDEADLLAVAPQLGLGERPELVASTGKPARLHPAQRADQAQQRGLARARGPRHDHELAARPLEIDPRQHLLPRLAFANA